MIGVQLRSPAGKRPAGIGARCMTALRAQHETRRPAGNLPAGVPVMSIPVDYVFFGGWTCRFAVADIFWHAWLPFMFEEAMGVSDGPPGVTPAGISAVSRFLPGWGRKLDSWLTTSKQTILAKF